MKIFDENKRLLGIYISGKKIKKGKQFITNNSSEFQVGKFNLAKGDKILNHFHSTQLREVKNTSEAIFVVEGKIKVNFFSQNKKFVKNVIVASGDTIVLLDGGHGIEILESSKFIEIKQGPYVEAIDKTVFDD
jgi:quercetin dioxygenase-like cupin family protein